MGHGIINNLSDAISWIPSSSLGGVSVLGATREIYYTPGDDSTGITQQMIANGIIKFVLFGGRGISGFSGSHAGGVGGAGEMFSIELLLEPTDSFILYCAGTSYTTGRGGLGGIPSGTGNINNFAGSAGTYGGAGGGASGEGYTVSGDAYNPPRFYYGGAGGNGGSAAYVLRKRDGESVYTFIFGALGGGGGGGGVYYGTWSDRGGQGGRIGTKTSLLMTGGAGAPGGSNNAAGRSGDPGYSAGTNNLYSFPKIEVYEPE